MTSSDGWSTVAAHDSDLKLGRGSDFVVAIYTL